MKKTKFKDRLSYWIDNNLSKGSFVLIIWIFTAVGLLVLFSSFIVVVTGNAPLGDDGKPLGLIQTILWSLSLVLNTDLSTSGFLILPGLLLAVSGIFILSSIGNVLANGLQERLDKINQGRSRVLETDHTVILGWSPQIFTIISELVLANENRKSGAVIVILGEKSKTEMEREIAERINSKNSRIICRSGSPLEPDDLEIVSPNTSRSIIVLPPDGKDQDSYVIKSIISLTENPNRRPFPYHIVAPINEPDKTVFEHIGRNDRINLIPKGITIARVIIHATRHSNIARVYDELFNFGGDEIYFKHETALVGKTYKDAIFAYETSAVLGLRLGDGVSRLNPPMHTKIEPNVQIIALSTDDDTIVLSKRKPTVVDKTVVINKKTRIQKIPENNLILGWNSYTETLIIEFDKYIPKSSKITVASSHLVDIEYLKTKIKKQSIEFKQIDATKKLSLQSLDLDSFDHVIVLSDENLGAQLSDARTLLTLTILSNFKMKGAKFTILSEFRDIRNQIYAESLSVNDFIVSERLMALMLSQISENSELQVIFDDIFAPEGSEIYMKPISDYVKINSPINFYSLVESAKQKGETAIGYVKSGEYNKPQSNYGVYTNPIKSKNINFEPGDKLIVLAEE